MCIFDVGGGFSGDIFEIMVVVFDSVFDEYFLVGFGVDIIVEFGCYYVFLVFIIVCNVIV